MAEETKTAKPNPENESPRKRRRHGYRGYPNTSSGGDVHFGTGFGGAGSTAGTGSPGLPKAGVISDRTREDVEKETGGGTGSP